MEADEGVPVVRFKDQEQDSGDPVISVIRPRLAAARAWLRSRLGSAGAWLEWGVPPAPGCEAGWAALGALICCPHFAQKPAPAGTSFPQLLQNAMASSSLLPPYGSNHDLLLGQSLAQKRADRN